MEFNMRIEYYSVDAVGNQENVKINMTGPSIV